MGAGHGRLAFHILQHLENRIALSDVKIPPYCYVLSDIVESNLNFYRDHPQLQDFFNRGILDFAYYDAIGGKEIHLRHANLMIRSEDLNQPMIAIANYFFDSIPNDVFIIQNKILSAVSIALHSKVNPHEADAIQLIKHLKLIYQKTALTKPFNKDPLIDELLNEYSQLLTDTHLFFPQKALQCLKNLTDLSSKGLLVLSMDKGFHEIRDLDHKAEPDIIKHGSFSVWVNYHALGSFCEKLGGKFIFPAYSTFYAEIGCLFFMPDGDSYQETNAAYQRFINDFGPDDFNSLKKLTYSNILKLKLTEILAFIRLAAYDSTFVVKLMPRLKQLAHSVTFTERKRIAQTLRQVWHYYFDINESDHLAFNIAGLFYELGFHQEALDFYAHATISTGKKVDIFYNQILCYFQLRQDDLFRQTLLEAKELFPDNATLAELDKLDLTSQ